MITKTVKYVALGVLFFLFGCHPQPIPPSPPPPDGVPACAASVVPEMDGQCAGLFTKDSYYACFACAGATHGCLDVASQVYCTTTCLGDSFCAALPNDAPMIKRTRVQVHRKTAP